MDPHPPSPLASGSRDGRPAGCAEAMIVRSCSGSTVHRSGASSDSRPPVIARLVGSTRPARLGRQAPPARRRGEPPTAWPSCRWRLGHATGTTGAFVVRMPACALAEVPRQPCQGRWPPATAVVWVPVTEYRWFGTDPARRTSAEGPRATEARRALVRSLRQMIETRGASRDSPVWFRSLPFARHPRRGSGGAEECKLSPKPSKRQAPSRQSRPASRSRRA
jgi:hypothetical protein